jgi:hypothetical protein
VVPSLKNPFCIPGLLGFACGSELDCAIGTCQTVSDRQLCASSCTSDADCARFDSNAFLVPETFSCVSGQCVSPTSFLLDFCTLGGPASDCADGFVCRSALPNLPAGLGLCVQPCDTNPVCPARAGFPQACVGQAEKSCVVSVFATPCTVDEGCAPGLRCGLTALGRYCTVSCATDAECQGNPHISRASYCYLSRYCVPKEVAGAACNTANQCRSELCTNGVCA